MFWKHCNCACNVFLNATSGVLSPYTRSVKNLEQSDKRCWLNKSPVGSHLNPSSVSLYPDAHWHSVPRDSSWTQKCSQPPLSTSHFLAVTEKQNKTYFNVKNTAIKLEESDVWSNLFRSFFRQSLADSYRCMCLSGPHMCLGSDRVMIYTGPHLTNRIICEQLVFFHLVFNVQFK